MLSNPVEVEVAVSSAVVVLVGATSVVVALVVAAGLTDEVEAAVVVEYKNLVIRD